NLLPNLWIFVAPVVFLASLNAAEYEYYTWKPETWVPNYGKSPQCMPIPEDLRLCYNVGYHQMLLPNLLDHETIAEVKQQAGSWVPLVHKACHPGTQVFLCSLFAPVCLDRPIYPCRWLCTPIMQAFGCDKFPLSDVCLSMNTTSNNDTDKSSGVYYS
ncbi:hypothetical protein M9458_021730, partial [Cirrhinus mrigala]